MIEPRDDHDSLGELELLLRAAQDYVRPTDDLRPRVLEAARNHVDQRRAITILRCAAVAALVLGSLTAEFRQWQASYGNRTTQILAWATSAQPLSTALPTASGADQPWDAVNSFTELRRRQAEILRPATGALRRKA